jgi:hypothetical protein
MTAFLRDPDELLADDDWQNLLLELAANLDKLVQNFLSELGPLDEYGGGMADTTDVVETAHITLEMLTRRLAGLPLGEQHVNAARDLGIRRARQGVPRDDLLDAVRLDFRVIWSTLTEIAGEGMEPVLVRNLIHVLATVEGYVSEVQQAFLTEQGILTRDSRLHTSRFVGRLFSSDPARMGAIDEIARGLSVDVDSEFEVVSVGSDGAADVQDALVRGELDPSWFTFDRGGGYVLFRPQPGAGRADEVLERLSGGIVSGVRGLAAVPAAAVTAARLAVHSGALGGGLVDWERGWLAVGADLVSRDVPGFGDDVWGQLDACTPYERARILETVIEYCRTGSVKETATNLSWHRNTIVNRLHAFQEISGLDVTRPLQAAAALLVLGKQPRLFSADFGRENGV